MLAGKFNLILEIRCGNGGDSQLPVFLNLLPKSKSKRNYISVLTAFPLLSALPTHFPQFFIAHFFNLPSAFLSAPLNIVALTGRTTGEN